ncbi:hypothetical protein [Kitasatospora purpeofusca]|uniref:hypothetical protein n=1 Tax=Kitasatospora purpeofusca TaxID=67352 RepID=UPI0036BBCB55
MSDDGGVLGIAGADVDLPATLRIAGLVLERTQSPASLACWTGSFPESAGGEAAVVSLVIEPAAPPEEAVLRLALDVVSNFDVLVDRAVRYCRTRLGERHFELAPEELSWLDLPELPLAGPEVVVWADRTWAIRFTESRFRLADPFGILVTFDGTRPVDVQGPEDEQ